MVIHLRMGRNIHQRPDCAGFGVARAEHQSADATVHHRPRAHNAGFEGDIQGGIQQTVVLQHHAALAQRHDFRMSGGIVSANGAVPPFADDAIVLHQYRADRHFPFIPCPLRQG